MIRSACVLVLIMHVIDKGCTISIGYIRNAAYMPTNGSVIIAYGSACSECICRRLLINSSSSSYVGLNCFENNKTCALFTNYSSTSKVRASLNSTFIFRKQPPPQNTTPVSFPLVGTLVAGRGNGSSGTGNEALTYPWGLAIDANDTLYVADSGNARVMKFVPGSLSGSRVAGFTTAGNNASQLNSPTEISLDASGNLYVNDNYNFRVMFWRKNLTFGVRVAGNGSSGATTNTFYRSIGLAVDSQRNIYLSDPDNHRVMKWLANATNGTVVAGVTGVAGNTNSRLNNPYGLYLDESNSSLYIADLGNHRIQKYRLGNPLSGTTVAGGNGYGSAANQLNGPYGICVSKKTGDIYIADVNNHRVQRWTPGASSGVTVVGITGVISTNLSLLNAPANVALNSDETYLYVSEIDNHRVQRFKLP